MRKLYRTSWKGSREKREERQQREKEREFLSDVASDE